MADFSKTLAIRHLPELGQASIHLSRVCMEDGAPAQAAQVQRAFDEFILRVEKRAVQWAELATAALRRIERGTRVRPDTGGFGGARLEDSLVAEPITELPGAVGIANETKLDEEVPWWITNEIGNRELVGRTISHGFFMEGGVSGFGSAGAAFEGASPSADEFRQHPLFVPAKGPALTIRNPIPARGFVLRTIKVMEPLWHTMMREELAWLDARWTEIMAVAERIALSRAL